MATEFRHEDGTLVARRWWGGDRCVVELAPGAGDTSMDTALRGDDGSTETLRTLADDWAGRRESAWTNLRGCPECDRGVMHTHGARPAVTLVSRNREEGRRAGFDGDDAVYLAAVRDLEPEKLCPEGCGRPAHYSGGPCTFCWHMYYDREDQ